MEVIKAVAVIFFSTHCPKCSALEMLLKKKNIYYIENNNVQEMLDLGLQSAPGLMVDGKVMNFPEAMKWVKEQ